MHTTHRKSTRWHDRSIRNRRTGYRSMKTLHLGTPSRGHVLTTRSQHPNVGYNIQMLATTFKCWLQHLDVVANIWMLCHNIQMLPTRVGNTAACCHNIPSNVVTRMPCRRNTPACHCHIPSRCRNMPGTSHPMSQALVTRSRDTPSYDAGIGFGVATLTLQSQHRMPRCQHSPW